MENSRKCGTCGEFLPLTEEHWYKDPARKHGFGYTCKKCRAIIAKERYQQKKAEAETRKCGRCGETYPLTEEYWYREGGEKEGLQYTCKKCRREMQEKYNHRAKEKGQQRDSNRQGRTQVCNKCGRELPLTTEYFHRQATAKRGFVYDCKECRKKVYKGYREKRKKEEEEAGAKVCVMCEKKYPLTENYWLTEDNGRDGFRDRCIKCDDLIKQKQGKKKGLTTQQIKDYEFEVGKRYKHYRRKSDRGKEAKEMLARNCTIIQNTDRFVVIQLENYRESVLKTDLIAGLEKLERVM